MSAEPGRDTAGVPAVGAGRRATSFGVLVHNDVYRELAAPERQALARRTALLFRHFLARGRTTTTKGTRGNHNSGWRRTPLGGNGGSHFYLWWSLAGTTATRGLPANDRTVVVRAVRHHDDHDPVTLGDLQDYVPVEVDSARDFASLPSPFTDLQDQFASSAEPIRLFFGQAGGGKTTALWRAIERADGGDTLYLTWSRRLAEEAEAHFGASSGASAFAPAGARVDARAFRWLLGRITGTDVPVQRIASLKAKFGESLARLQLAPQDWPSWQRRPDALYAELRAWRAGAVGDLKGGLLDEAAYIESRLAAKQPEAAVREAARIWQKLGLDAPDTLAAHFPEVAAAHEAYRRLRDRSAAISDDLLRYRRIAVDELQDLTMIELATLVALVARTRATMGVLPELICAGDEGQTVRPSGFGAAWFKSLIVERLQRTPAEFMVDENLRCPEEIAAVVERAGELYRDFVDKADRPRKSVRTESVNSAHAWVLHHRADNAAEARELVDEIVRSGAATCISLRDRLPGWLANSEYADAILTPEDTKGLDYSNVVIVDLGDALGSLRSNGSERLDDTNPRSTIDRIRVALSRATDTLAVIDVDADDSGVPSRSAEILFGLEPAQHIQHSADSVRSQLLDDSELPLERALRFIANAERDYEERPSAAWRSLRAAIEATEKAQKAKNHDTSLVAEIFEDALRITVALLSSSGAEIGPLRANIAKRSHLLARHLRPETVPFVDALRPHPPLSMTQAQRVELVAAAAAVPRGVRPAWIRQSLRPYQHMLLNDLDASRRSVAVATRLAQDVEEWFELLEPEGSAADRARALRVAAVPVLLEHRKLADAERVAARIVPPDDAVTARLCEALEKWGDASRAYERAGLIADAFRCAREAGDVSRALTLAAPSDDVTTLKELDATVTFLRQWQQRKLTVGERALLSELTLQAGDLRSALAAGRQLQEKRIAEFGAATREAQQQAAALAASTEATRSAEAAARQREKAAAKDKRDAEAAIARAAGLEAVAMRLIAENEARAEELRRAPRSTAAVAPGAELVELREFNAMYEEENRRLTGEIGLLNDAVIAARELAQSVEGRLTTEFAAERDALAAALADATAECSELNARLASQEEEFIADVFRLRGEAAAARERLAARDAAEVASRSGALAALDDLLSRAANLRLAIAGEVPAATPASAPPPPADAAPPPDAAPPADAAPLTSPATLRAPVPHYLRGLLVPAAVEALKTYRCPAGNAAHRLRQLGAAKTLSAMGAAVGLKSQPLLLLASGVLGTAIMFDGQLSASQREQLREVLTTFVRTSQLPPMLTAMLG